MILDQLEPTVKPHPQSTPGNSLTQLCIQILILWLLVHTGKAACSTLPPPVPCGLLWRNEGMITLPFCILTKLCSGKLWEGAIPEFLAFML